MDTRHGYGCQHSGFHSGMGLYSRDAEEIRYVLVCDECGEEVKQVSTESYVPNPVDTPNPVLGVA
jgi:hypothetical protein